MESTQEQKPDHVVAQDDSDEEFSIEVVKDISQEQEASLFTFLQKVKKACKEDDSVPDFVGSQVTEWLQELQEKGSLAPEK